MRVCKLGEKIDFGPRGGRHRVPRACFKVMNYTEFRKWVKNKRILDHTPFERNWHEIRPNQVYDEALVFPKVVRVKTLSDRYAKKQWYDYDHWKVKHVVTYGGKSSWRSYTDRDAKRRDTYYVTPVPGKKW